MKEYNFEYLNLKFKQKLLACLIALFLLLFISIGIILAKIHVKNFFFDFLLTGVFSFIITFSIFSYNKKKLKKIGFAIIHESCVELNLDGIKREINYDDIRSYLILHYEGTLLNLVLNDGEKINVSASYNYCDTIKFRAFCMSLEKVLENYENNTHSIIREKTIFEKVWVKPFLIIVTCILVCMFIYAFATGKKLPPTYLLLNLLPLLTLWGGYFAARNRKRK